MSSRRIIATTVVLAACLGATAVSPAEGAAPLNTATATGASRPETPTLGTVSSIAIDAHSGPGGTSPGGSVSFDVWINRITHLEPFPLHFEGPVSCLDVAGHRALINFDWGGLPVTVELDDNGGGGNDGFGLTSGNPADECAAPGQPTFEF